MISLWLLIGYIGLVWVLSRLRTRFGRWVLLATSLTLVIFSIYWLSSLYRDIPGAAFLRNEYLDRVESVEGDFRWGPTAIFGLLLFALKGTVDVLRPKEAPPKTTEERLWMPKETVWSSRSPTIAGCYRKDFAAHPCHSAPSVVTFLSLEEATPYSPGRKPRETVEKVRSLEEAAPNLALAPPKSRRTGQRGVVPPLRCKRRMRLRRLLRKGPRWTRRS